MVYIKQDSTNATISFAKDSVMDFIDFVSQAMAKDKGLDKIESRVKEICGIHDALNDWEKEFIASVAERISKRGVDILSGKQIQIIDRIYTDKIIGSQD